MRIDLVLASAPVVERAEWCIIDRNARKGKQPSDHAPVIVDLRRVDPRYQAISGNPSVTHSPAPLTTTRAPMTSATTRRWRGLARTAAGMYQAGSSAGAAVVDDPRFGVVAERSVRIGRQRQHGELLVGERRRHGHNGTSGPCDGCVAA